MHTRNLRTLRTLLPNALLAHSLLAFGLVALGTGCKDVTATLPAGTPDPAAYNTPTGAIEKRNNVYKYFETAFLNYEHSTAELTDELGGGTGATPLLTGSLDQRFLPESGTDFTDNNYQFLQQVRARATEALGALAKYDTVHSPALRGEMYALEGYTEVMLAELFCSGVPLSTYDFEADFTYKPGSTQQQVYQDAIAKFDTALALSADSVRFMNLARVGLGRAYLDLGDYVHAAAAVAAVPDGFRYQVNLPLQNSSVQAGYPASERSPEGINGLPFKSGGDPRTQDVATGTVIQGAPYYWPVKYASALSAPYYSEVTLADGVEARLIEAEAALHANDPGWLTTLNALRTAGGATLDTVADTLGVTQCGGVCGYDPGNGLGGDTPDFGQPYPGGYVPPAGFTYAGTDTTTGAHTVLAPDGETVKDYCFNYSYYIPCYQGDLLVVQYYTKLKANPTWSPGTGGVGGLALLSDPGNSANDTARVNLVFRERAYWLYRTGHRQGDLRRLVRNYHRDQSTVYPTGPFGVNGQYGSDVTAPIPATEDPNPYFHGCLDRNA